MAPLHFKEMKTVDISCAPTASTTIYNKLASLTIAQSSSDRVISRSIPRVKDLHRARAIMCSVSEAPITPKPYHTQKSSKRKLGKQPADHHHHQLIKTPGSSSRYLLNNDPLFDVQNNDTKDTAPTLVTPVKAVQLQDIMKDKTDNHVIRQSDSSSITEKPKQVVVLKVSLHCKGCEKKVRKHISRIEGVASFDIDFAAKKVTVIGELTPLEVLNRMSKIKFAQLCPLPPNSSSAST